MNRRLALFGQDRCERDGSVEERRRDFVAPIFAKGDLDDVGKGIAIQDRADGIPHVEHQYSEPAMNFIRARAAGVGCLADAADRRQWAIDHANDLAKFDLVHGPGERVATKFSASALHVSGRF